LQKIAHHELIGLKSTFFTSLGLMEIHRQKLQNIAHHALMGQNGTLFTSSGLMHNFARNCKTSPTINLSANKKAFTILFFELVTLKFEPIQHTENFK
jgi:hypothetical protein